MPRLATHLKRLPPGYLPPPNRDPAVQAKAQAEASVRGNVCVPDDLLAEWRSPPPGSKMEALQRELKASLCERAKTPTFDQTKWIDGQFQRLLDLESRPLVPGRGHGHRWRQLRRRTSRVPRAQPLSAKQRIPPNSEVHMTGVPLTICYRTSSTTNQPTINCRPRANVLGILP